MKLHQKGLQRNIGRRAAPILSKITRATRTTQLLRKLIAYLNYVIGRGSGANWHLEAEVNSAFGCIYRKMPVVFDVGANVGEWSEAFRRLTPNGHLYLFEPQPVCQDNIRNRNLSASTLICSGVGKEAGKQLFYTSSATDHSASLSERQETFFQDSQYSSYEIDVIKLDDFIQRHDLAFIDFIKFDIEGHEFDALMGMKNALDRRAIGAFSFEFGSGNLNSRTNLRDFWKLLTPHYKLAIITPGGFLDPVPEYYEDLEYYRGVSNYIALLTDHPYATRK